ncbi:MAG: glycosyltransferase family 4 protein [Bacteroidales bacterium]|nr:glycosyltransferase family 4 protein [Bacteroidales bacterium]
MNIWAKYVLIALSLVALELLYFAVAKRLGIVDNPNARSSHKSVVLRGGGVVFLFGAWLWAAFFGLAYPWFLAGLTLIAAVSFADDVKSLPDGVRLVVQFTAMALMFKELGLLQWNLWWAVIIALIVCVGIINAYNFMDGINGITGAYSLAVALPLLAIESISHSLIIVIILADLVFCFFNFRTKAKCFAGDVGAVTMAFLLVFGVFSVIIATGDFSYIMLLAVYGVDSVLTIIHRIMLHENLGKAHRKHAYQIMANELGLPHVLVSGIYAVLQLAVSAGLLLLPVNHYVYSAVVLAALGVGYLLFMKKYYHLHEEYLKNI